MYIYLYIYICVSVERIKNHRVNTIYNLWKEDNTEHKKSCYQDNHLEKSQTDDTEQR